MSDHRGSYLKTILVALAAGILPGLLAFAGVGWAWLHGTTWPWWRWLVWAVAVLGLWAAAGLATLVVVGGCIALRRDGLQSRGLPYASGEARERQAGPIVQALRGLSRALRALLHLTPDRLGLRPGEIIVVRPLEEILATLDEQGRLDSLPFMPEMSAFCGRQARVLRRVDKINDYVGRTGLRRMRDTVLLEQLRCPGTGHGGCQASCHLLWKEAWLARPAAARTRRVTQPGMRPRVTADDLAQQALTTAEDGSTRYVCQMTEVAAGTTPIRWGDPRHWLRDILTGNVRPGPFCTGLSLFVFIAAHHRRGGATYPNRAEIRARTTPHVSLGLQPGERVRVKPLAAIEQTLNYDSRNRGLWFDRDMIRHCGGEYRVLARVDRIINERSGKLVELATPIILLEGVTATGEHLAFCPQNDAIFWREIWLERLPEAGTSAAT